MNTTITSAWEKIIRQFFPVFTVPTGQVFLSLVSGWVLSGKRMFKTFIIFCKFVKSLILLTL